MTGVGAAARGELVSYAHNTYRTHVFSHKHVYSATPFQCVFVVRCVCQLHYKANMVWYGMKR